MKQHNKSRPSNRLIALAIAALVNAPDWPQTYRALIGWRRILLSVRTLEVISFTVTQLYFAGEIAEARNWQQYESLLRDALIVGIPMAWNTFMREQAGGGWEYCDN